MPAAEREIVSALKRAANISSGQEILLLSTADSTSNAAIVDAAGPGSKITVLQHWEDLEAPKHHGRYDAAIVNKMIVGSKIISDSAKLEALIKNCLKALKMGAAVIVREDLNGFLATDKVAGLTAILDVYRMNAGEKVVGFDFRSLKQLEASVHAKQNFLDVYWTLTKKEFLKKTNGDPNATFRDFLDKTQYTDTGIGAYEWIFGEDFISPGGAEENLRVLKQFGELKCGQTMLDIGVGIGGGARQAAWEFGLEVLGIDLSSNMLSIAMDRLHRDKDTRVRYHLTNALECDYGEEVFDTVFSRDCLQHNDDMGLMMRKIYRWLKPGGRVLITMYGKGHGELQPKFKEYVAQRQYHLKTLEEMVQMTKDAGFRNVEGKNLTPRFKEILLQELKNAVDNKEEFLKKFSEKKYAGLIDGWNDKLGYISDDNHNWIQIFGVKPSQERL